MIIMIILFVIKNIIKIMVNISIIAIIINYNKMPVCIARLYCKLNKKRVPIDTVKFEVFMIVYISLINVSNYVWLNC